MGGEDACVFFDEVVFSRKVRRHTLICCNINSVCMQSKKRYYKTQLVYKYKSFSVRVSKDLPCKYLANLRNST